MRFIFVVWFKLTIFSLFLYGTYYQNGVVSSQDSYTSQTGLKILQNGGNAIDAAVAMAYTMAVTHPRAGNLGGGGFMLIYIKRENKIYALDYREKAPLNATRNMFLDEKGRADNNKSRFSILSTGVPGTVAGLETAHQTFGSIARKELLKDAIHYAKNGFIIDKEQEKSLKRVHQRFLTHKSTKKVFIKKDKSQFKKGDTLIQKDLAKTLIRIQKYGQSDFYNGKTAKKITSFMKKNNGLITMADLASYKAIWRKPISGTYKDYHVYSMPPPSSGGIAIVQALNILEAINLTNIKHNSEDYIHAVSEATKFVYADRATYLGDTDFVTVPVQTLTSKAYAKQIADKISNQHVYPSSKITPLLGKDGIIHLDESLETTHFSVIDQYGNVVSNTYTLNFGFGNGIVAEGTGILLNNEMDDFVSKPGEPNAYGLIGNEKNAIAPQKRMLSSMSPTIVLKDNQPILVTGSPGGSTIITSVLQVILNVIEYQMPIAEASEATRFHHQWTPNHIAIEKPLANKVKTTLTKKGHTIKAIPSLGITQSILITNQGMSGYSDPRSKTSLTLGY